MTQIIALVVSLIPSAAIFFFLRNGLKQDDEHKKHCGRMFVRGFFAAIPIFLLSLVCNLFWKALGLFPDSQLAADLFLSLILTAGSEEIVKYMLLNKTLQEKKETISWLQIIAYQAIIGLAFGVNEDLLYALSTNVGQILVRGVAMGHVGYGLLMGYFRGKGMKTGKKSYAVLAFCLPYLMHALYNFSLKDSVVQNDIFVFTAVTLAVLDLMLWIFFVLKLRKWRNETGYTEALFRKETKEELS